MKLKTYKISTKRQRTKIKKKIKFEIEISTIKRVSM
jgi:hypothetical protein